MEYKKSTSEIQISYAEKLPPNVAFIFYEVPRNGLIPSLWSGQTQKGKIFGSKKFLINFYQSLNYKISLMNRRSDKIELLES